MRVGVLGSGIVGRTLGAGFLKHGHQAMIGTRDPDKQEAADWVRGTPGDRKSTRLNSSHEFVSRMPSSA